jgi:hypothetical protein
MEAAARSPLLVQLVIKNFGPTAAHNVSIKIDPDPQRTNGQGGVEGVWLPDDIPVLAPGQAWSTLWDFTRFRFNQEPPLPDRYDVSIFFVDPNEPNRPPETSQAVLDWSQFKGRRWATTHGAHETAVALRDIRDLLARWSTGGLTTKGLRVYPVDPDNPPPEQYSDPTAVLAAFNFEDLPPGAAEDPPPEGEAQED